MSLVSPAFFSCPEFTRSHGPEVAEMCEMAGFAPDPEQQLLLDAIFAVDQFGRPMSFDVSVVCARQNLKTGLLKQVALGKVFLLERKLFVWSAHEFNTAKEAFRDLTILIENCPELDREVLKIFRGSGVESIELRGDRRIVFKARTKVGGRGLTGDDVVLDEAFALTGDHMGALMPTLSTRPAAQIFLASSACLATSDVLHEAVRAGRRGDAERSVYAEWCAPPPAEVCDRGDACSHERGTPGCGCDRQDLWQLANPQMGHRISVQYVADERRKLKATEFGRERMGWHDPQLMATFAVISEEAWTACGNQELPRPSGRVVFALDVNMERTAAAVAVAGVGPDGGLGVELVEFRVGVDWVEERVAALFLSWPCDGVVIDPSGPAGTFSAALEAAGVTVIKPDTRQACQSAEGFFDLVTGKRLQHGCERPLDDAVAAAAKRPVGDAWAWGRRSAKTDICPLVAASFAVWGFQTNADVELGPDDVYVGV